MSEQLLKIDEVRRKLDCSRGTVYNLIKKGTLPKAIKTPFGPRWRESTIDELITGWEKAS